MAKQNNKNENKQGTEGRTANEANEEQARPSEPTQEDRARSRENVDGSEKGVRTATAKDAENNRYANYNRPMEAVRPKDNEGIQAPVPGVDAGASFAEDKEGKIDKDLAEAATMRPIGAQGGSQTDRLTGVQQQAQPLGKKDQPSYDGAIQTKGGLVNLAGYRQGDPGDTSRGKEDGTVIESADGRSLFVGINGNHWEGSRIVVPGEYAEEARRILVEGGYYLK